MSYAQPALATTVANETKGNTMNRLLEMLTYTRPHDSANEQAFIAKFIKPYHPTPYLDAKGETLAYVIDVADRMSVVPPVLWSCHTDTVHHSTDLPIQEVVYDPGCGMAYKSDGRPLGADDGAGIWLMLEMIDAGVPGSYIFHRGEERGGIGSRGMAKDHAGWLSRFRYAIAFDRKGTTSIITEQGWSGQCCSDEFALALARSLNDQDVGFEYTIDPTGVFTDTANYTDIIPECTNVSVGYEDEHTGKELLDVWHVERLRDALIKAFADGVEHLPVERDPTTVITDRWGSSFGAVMPSPEELAYMSLTDIEDFVYDTDVPEVAELLRSMATRIEELEAKAAFFPDWEAA